MRPALHDVAHDQSRNLRRVRYRAHVSGAADNDQLAIRKEVPQKSGDHACWGWSVLALKHQNRECEGTVGIRRRRLLHQSAEVERCLGIPADESILQYRTHGVPGAGPVPIVDEAGNGTSIVPSENAMARALCNVCDLRVGTGTGTAHEAEQVERRGLVKHHAGDLVGAGNSCVEGDGPSVGVADKVKLLLAFVDKCNRSGSLVGKRECVLSGPRPSALTPEVLGGHQLVAAAKRRSKMTPLAGAGSRAMQRYDPRAARRPRRVDDIDIHRIRTPASSTPSSA